MTQPSSQPSDNPLSEALRGLFGPLLDMLKGLPPLLAFGGVTMVLVVVIALLGAVVPDNLVPLLYVAFGLSEITFLVWSLQNRPQPGLKPSEPEIEPGEPVAQPAPIIPPADPTLRAEPQDKADLRQRYLHRLLSECNQLHLTAIDRKVATRPEAAELDLSEVFTALDVSESAQRLDEKAVRMEREDNRRPAIAALAENPRLVLLGEPGSGKTTLVRFVSVCLAGDELGLADLNARRLGDEWARLPRLFPIRVTLRDYAARGLPQGVGLWDFIVAELARVEDDSLADFAPQLRRVLERQGGLLLLDGLDEVPDANQQRQRLKAAVERFAQDYPHCRILVTSRPYAYQDPAWRLAGFELRRLTDFDPEQIQNFIEKWYQQVAAKDVSLGADDAARYTAQLQNAVQSNPRLAELAPRPLLLTLMASLHRWRHGGALPDEREELYDESVKLLIDLWQRPKQKFDAQGDPAGEEYSVWDELCISPKNLRAALNQVAFKAHRDQPELTGTHDVPLDDLAGVLFRASEDRAAISIEKVCRYVRDRAGLLVDRGQDVFAFPHRTFQEYLAACHLTDYDFPRELARLARQDDERWREAVLLAAAKAARGSTSNVWLLAEALCPRRLDETPGPQPGDYYTALRAAQALVETKQHQQVDEWNQGKLERLRAWLTAALTQTGVIPPPDRAAAGRALSAIGDPRPGVTVLPPPGGDRGGGEPPLPDIAWCHVPAGTFIMGSPDDSLAVFGSESPQQTIELPAYLISRYPITNAQFRPFVESDGYANSDYWTPEGWRYKESGNWTAPDLWDDPRWNLDNHPVVGVSWYETIAFCRWLERKWANGHTCPGGQCQGMGKWANTGWQTLAGVVRPASLVLRLPTEAEWEKAARGSEGRVYPWGNTWQEDRCNSIEANVNRTSAVGIFPTGAAPCGAQDLSGNVWEWCSTRWQEKYPLPQVAEWSDDYLDGTSPRLVRGGSLADVNRSVRGAFRDWYDPLNRLNYVGFRVAAGSSAWL